MLWKPLHQLCNLYLPTILVWRNRNSLVIFNSNLLDTHFFNKLYYSANDKWLVLFYLVLVTLFWRESYKTMKTKTFASRNWYSLKRNNCIPHWVRRSFSPAHSSIKKTRSPNSCQNRILRPRCHYVLNNKTKHPSLPWFTVFPLFHILWYSE